MTSHARQQLVVEILAQALKSAARRLLRHEEALRGAGDIIRRKALSLLSLQLANALPQTLQASSPTDPLASEPSTETASATRYDAPQ